MRLNLAPLSLAIAAAAMAAAAPASAQVKIVAAPDLQARLRALGLTPTGTTAAALSTDLASDYAYWAQLVREVGVKAE